MKNIYRVLVFAAFMALSLSSLWLSPAHSGTYVKEPRGFGLVFGERDESGYQAFSVMPRKGWSRAAEIHCVGFDGKVRHSNFYMPGFTGKYEGHIYMPVDNAKCFIKESKP